MFKAAQTVQNHFHTTTDDLSLHRSIHARHSAPQLPYFPKTMIGSTYELAFVDRITDKFTWRHRSYAWMLVCRSVVTRGLPVANKWPSFTSELLRPYWLSNELTLHYWSSQVCSPTPRCNPKPKEFYFPGYNTVQSAVSQPTFRRYLKIRRPVPPKRQLDFNRLHRIILRKHLENNVCELQWSPPQISTVVS
jgi:hypothetical protein